MWHGLSRSKLCRNRNGQVGLLVNQESSTQEALVLMAMPDSIVPSLLPSPHLTSPLLLPSLHPNLSAVRQIQCRQAGTPSAPPPSPEVLRRYCISSSGQTLSLADDPGILGRHHWRQDQWFREALGQNHG
ncbi:hypothetical protein VTH06DRAFT_2267 [Thermothelomyces fergusii]